MTTHNITMGYLQQCAKNFKTFYGGQDIHHVEKFVKWLQSGTPLTQHHSVLTGGMTPTQKHSTKRSYSESNNTSNQDESKTTSDEIDTHNVGSAEVGDLGSAELGTPHTPYTPPQYRSGNFSSYMGQPEFHQDPTKNTRIAPGRWRLEDGSTPPTIKMDRHGQMPPIPSDYAEWSPHSHEAPPNSPMTPDSTYSTPTTVKMPDNGEERYSPSNLPASKRSHRSNSPIISRTLFQDSP